MGFRDAIAEPWGTRTPYGPGEQWPARVDRYLAEGVRAEDVQRWVRTASLLHSDGDAMDIAVVDGRMVGVRGRADDRVNRGRLGPKDLFGWQANAAPDRLRRPLVREGGELVETDWDTAMGRVVAESKRCSANAGRPRSRSTPPGSSSWRSTSPWPRSGTGRSAPATWTATRASAPRRPRRL